MASTPARPRQPDPQEHLQQQAWVGDAVLELYVRNWVLKNTSMVDAEMKTRFTCNQFLNCLGNPTKVEAEIGGLYQAKGLQAAFDFIQTTLEPLFIKQEANRTQKRR